MFIDTHMHEMTYSPDSFLKLEEMVRIGKEKGLGALCITDHDSMGLKDYAAEYTARTGFPILLGLSFILFRETLSHLELKITRKSESRHRIL